MTPLNLSPASPEWREVLRYIESRRLELLADVTSLTTSDQHRRDAAVRLDELAELMSAPDQTMQAAQSRLDAEVTTRPTY